LVVPCVTNGGRHAACDHPRRSGDSSRVHNLAHRDGRNDPCGTRPLAHRNGRNDLSGTGPGARHDDTGSDPSSVKSLQTPGARESAIHEQNHVPGGVATPSTNKTYTVNNSR
jgi:hypothetical protein